MKNTVTKKKDGRISKTLSKYIRKKHKESTRNSTIRRCKTMAKILEGELCNNCKTKINTKNTYGKTGI